MLDDFSESGSESESEPGAEEHADSHATPGKLTSCHCLLYAATITVVYVTSHSKEIP